MTDELPCHCIICVDHDVDLDDFDRRTIGLVQEHGWVAQAVAADDSGPGWAYTVGLWHTLRSPEIAIFGIDDLATMQHCLNGLGDAIREGRTLVVDQERDDVIEGLPVTIKAVHRSWHEPLFGQALYFYQHSPVPFMEVVWPDRSGLFPWQDGCAAGVRDRQPQLWIPKPNHPAGVWADLP
ncbi:DUF4262 domain-containing protein [Nonomuraea sp. NPDC059194]|uniref:DUF4262 domain-containing protein n=1 Tax=Nonomuraea sp. NPDC059194 TaxID=3346764 RepID=UPI0036B00EE5